MASTHDHQTGHNKISNISDAPRVNSEKKILNYFNSNSAITDSTAVFLKRRDLENCLPGFEIFLKIPNLQVSTWLWLKLLNLASKKVLEL